jgi:hypothetical protein
MLNERLSASGHSVASRAARQMLGQIVHEAAALRDRDETVGRNGAERGMLPTRQGLEAHDSLGRQIDQRLIMRLHLRLEDSAGQIALDEIALLGARIHLGVEKARGRMRLLVLGAIKRDIGTAQNLDVTWPVLGKERDPDADAEAMLQPPRGDRLVDFLDYPERNAGGLFGAWQFACQNCEFVTAEARHQILLAGGTAQPYGDVDQHFVADAVAV